MSTRTRGTLAAAFTALLAAAAPAPAASAAQPGAPAETVLVNGRIHTIDAGGSIVQALAIRDGRIVAVGTDAEIRQRMGPSTELIDLDGRTATPGLIDTHAHIAAGGYKTLYTLDLSDATGIAEVRRRVAARAATLVPGQWLVGVGWDEGKLAERRYPVAGDLDPVAPANPVWLLHTTGHYGVANTRALELGGINSASKDPAAGTIDRDANGNPTGVLKEDAMRSVVALIPAPSAEQTRNGILASIELMHREGMTGVKDPSIDSAQWEAYRALAEQGKLGAHVCVLWGNEPTLDGARATIARLAGLPKPPQAIHQNLVSCGVKLFMDGSGGARTAWMYQDWNRNGTDLDTGNHGYPAIDPGIYREQVRLFNAAGVHVSTHAIGDRAIDWVVDTYAQVLNEQSGQDLRHGIIHANTPTDHAIDVMAALQRDHHAGYPETQAPFTWWIGDNYAGNLGTERAQRLNPYRTYRERGIRWGGGSDYFVTPLPARYGLWASVERRTLRGSYGAQPFGTAQSVDAATALKSYTIWAAHQLFLDTEAGSLEAGKSADVAVWDRDPLGVPAAELEHLKCEMTLFRGKVVFRAKH